MNKFLVVTVVASLVLSFASPALAANNPPQVVSVTPSQGTTPPKRLVTFTSTYSDSDGAGNISLAYILINTSANTQNCFAAYYDNNTNKLYLLSDQGTPIGGFKPGSFRIIRNSYCRLKCSQTQVTKSGNTITITWAVRFDRDFSGKSYNTYLKAQDKAGASTGWVKKGTWLVNYPPLVGRLIPLTGSSWSNQEVRFTSIYIDKDGANNISLARIHINTSTSLENCFSAYYDNSTNKLYMLNNQGAPIGGYAPGSSNIIENSYARLDCSKTTVLRPFNNRLRLDWYVTFKSSFVGIKNTYLSVSDQAGASTGWVQLGTYTIRDELEKAYLHIYERMDAYRQSGERLIESYAAPYPPYNQYTAYTYDNALAIIALLARHRQEDLARAKLLCQTLIWAQENDPTFDDGRIRDGYWSTDIRDPNGRYASVMVQGSGCGNMAWTIIAWMQYYRYSQDSDYTFLNNLLEASERLGEFISLEYRDPLHPGYRGGFYWDWQSNALKKSQWKSTEHNLDVYVAFLYLYNATDDIIWLERANYAKEFIISRMWNSQAGMFWVGTTDDGWTPNTTPTQQAEDVNSWAILALNDVSSYEKALDWVENNCAVSCNGIAASQPHTQFDGFDFNTDKDGVWFEGTAHMALAYKIAGEASKADYYINELRKAQNSALNTNFKCIVAACHNNLSTGFGWDYFASPHIGATSWYIAAEQGYNMFWGKNE